jgi:hypothetical protein
MAVGVAVAAASGGGEVQLVGKVGDDPAGEAALLDLASRSVGHVAILRDPSLATPETADREASEPVRFDDEPGDETGAATPPSTSPAAAPTLDAADLDLALRYLPDYRVVVLADPLPGAALDVIVAASRWSGAALVIVLPKGASVPNDAAEATVLEAPADDADGAFAAIVGAYAVALDRGEEPAEAFATASATGGWAAVAD